MPIKIFTLLQDTFLIAYLWFETVHDLVPIQSNLLNLNHNPLNLGQKLFFRIFLNFEICLR